MGRIPDQQIEEILNRLDVVEVIGQYVPLKRVGRNFKARCPFHNEKTPSFMVSQEKQIWHCFGCGTGGNIFSFCMRMENVSFPEAARMMADKAGIRIEEAKGDPARAGYRERLYEVNERAVQFFQGKLKEEAEGAEVRRYLEQRGIDQATQDLFRLGWAPRSKDAFSRWAEQQGLSRELLVKLGLTMDPGQSGCPDRFRGRLMFPIADPRGRVIGFGARVIDSSGPKYINSQESELFHKGQSLYGIQATQSDIRKTRQVICVEGYTDLLMLYQKGIRNAVATLGTALTPEHARLIRRFADECTLVFDSDSAGQEAMLRGAEVLMPYDLGVKVLRLPRGKDPADMVRDEGPARFLELVHRAQDLFEFKMRVMLERHGMRDVRSQWKVVSALIPTLIGLPNAVVRAGYIRKLASTLSLPEDSIRVELNKARQRGRKKEATPPPAVREQGDRSHPEERILIGIMLEDEEAIAFIKGHLKSEDFRHPDLRLITQLIFDQTARGNPLGLAQLIKEVASPRVEPLLTAIWAESEAYVDRPQMMEDCIRRIKQNQRNVRLMDLKNRIRQEDEERDDPTRMRLLSEFQKVQGA